MAGAFRSRSSPWSGLLSCAIREDDSVRPIEVAYAISLPAWIFALIGGNVTSASPDCISSCLMIHLFLIFACLVVSSHEEEWKRDFGEVLAVGALCLCFKLNSLGLVVGIWTIATILFYKRAGPTGVLRKPVLLIVGLPTFLLGTWMWRGITLSGYPFFPSTALAMPVEWRMPRKEVWQFYGLTVWCARDPHFEGSMKRALKTWKWLPHWSNRVRAGWKFALAALFALAGNYSFVQGNLIWVVMLPVILFGPGILEEGTRRKFGT